MSSAVKSLQEAAKLGLNEAKYNLAVIYLNGLMGASQKAQGLAYLKDAADNNYLPAIRDLAGVLLDGLYGIAQDPKVGVQYLVRQLFQPLLTSAAQRC